MVSKRACCVSMKRQVQILGKAGLVFRVCDLGAVGTGTGRSLRLAAYHTGSRLSKKPVSRE